MLLGRIQRPGVKSEQGASADDDEQGVITGADVSVQSRGITIEIN
jgi:hypothetical protein